MGATETKNFSQKGFTKNLLGLMKELERQKKCCEDFLTRIFTENSDTVIFTGLGTKASPLIATATGGVGSANNGASVVGSNIVLGQSVAQVGDPGKFLSNREFFLNGNSLFFRTGVTQLNSVPAISISKVDGTVIGAITSDDITNIFIGVGAGALNSSVVSGGLVLGGHHNTAVGNDALAANTAGIFSTAIGTEALAANTTGIFNTAIGSNAMAVNTTGIENTAVGVNALHNANGDFNTAIGINALQANNGGSNVSVGLGSSFNNDTGQQNSVLGTNAFENNISGSDNVAIGYQALDGNTTGGNNIGIGSLSLTSNQTGSFNTAVGVSALAASLVGSGNVSKNTVVGAGAAQQQLTGDENVLVGYHVAFNQHIGANNVLIGSSILPNAVIANSIIIGQGITTGLSNVVFLGRSDQNTLLGADNTSTDSGARLQIHAANGYSQLQLASSYTPTSSADANGAIGAITWDTGFIYVKTAAGAWKRSALSTF